MSTGRFLLALSAVFLSVAAVEDKAFALGDLELVISVAEQKMAVLKDGALLTRYPVSTSKFGVGDSWRSYRTPLGRMKICDKIGDGLSAGAVMKGRQTTGEILAVNAPGRDPIVTRILWLEGCESQNANARNRGIYIHGTPEERQIGKPVSFGCIRMRSRDVIELYEEIGVGASVTIVQEKLPRYQKYTAPAPEPEQILIVKKEKEAHLPAIASVDHPAKAHGAEASAAAEGASGRQSMVLSTARTTPEKVQAAGAPHHAAAGGKGGALGSFHSETRFSVSPGSRIGSRSDLTDTFSDSILLSGVDGGNSEIPQLNR